jgi:hypothetical protein
MKVKNTYNYKVTGRNFSVRYCPLLKVALLFLGITVSIAVSAGNRSSRGLIIDGQKDSISGIGIHFPVNQSRLLRNFADNDEALSLLEDILTERYLSFNVDSIVINGYASPEGAITNNLILAAERAEAVKTYIVRHFPHIHNKIITRSQLVDWDALSAIAGKDWMMPYREEVKMVLKLENINDIQKFRFLKSIGNGAALNYINKNYAPALRRASGIMFYGLSKKTVAAITEAHKKTTPPKNTEQQKNAAQPLKTTPVEKDTLYYPTVGDYWGTDTVFVNKPKSYSYSLEPLFAIKTNLLFDVATALNAEIEIPIGNRWSALGEVIFPWWLWEKRQNCFQLFSVNLEGRYWFGDRSDRPALTGWFAGFYAGGGYYDLEWDKKGYQGEFYIAAGLSGGYAHTLGKNSNFRMEYSIGLGYLNTQYRKYNAVYGIDDQWHLIRQHSGNYTWVGPTRLKVSLVWMLNYKSYKKKDKKQ